VALSGWRGIGADISRSGCRRRGLAVISNGVSWHQRWRRQWLMAASRNGVWRQRIGSAASKNNKGGGAVAGAVDRKATDGVAVAAGAAAVTIMRSEKHLSADVAKASAHLAICKAWR